MSSYTVLHGPLLISQRMMINSAKVRPLSVDGTSKYRNSLQGTGLQEWSTFRTDYVFDGQGSEPWHPDCKDYKPLNVYGQTKLDGELAVISTLDKYFIVRIAWVFGKNGKNFHQNDAEPWQEDTRHAAVSSATRSVHLPTPTTWPACWSI